MLPKIDYEKTDTLLSVKDVGLSFFDESKEWTPFWRKRERTEKVILSNVNFDVKDIIGHDQKVALVGKSGVGKTQLIRRLSGLYVKGAKNTGEVLIHHDRVQQEHVLLPVKEGDMGIVFQNYYMPEHLTIYKMLIKAAKKNIDYNGDSKLIIEAVSSYINLFELTEHKDKYPCQLSGGQKQRASIIMQLVNGSNFLLMDEPFSGLDPIMIDKTTKLLQKVGEGNELKTMIIVSHDLENCAAICDSIFVLSKNGQEENTGATIVAEVDLLAEGLAWHEDVKRMPEFHNVIENVKALL